MKKIIFTLAVTVFIAGILVTSCNSPSQKIENAEENVLDAKEAVIDAQSDLNLALQDSVTEFQQFKTEFQNQIIANEKTIAGLKLSIAGASQDNKVLYEKKLAELEEKNSDLKIKLGEYQEGETDQWQTFKVEFKHDMDELGKAFSDFTVRDKE
ncbi:MAG: hypothetical protein JW833_02570 [Prolixibacteraceae bacterium]|nr:hypothetical protein [Prolixibacteraceae bacterium]